MTLSRWVVVPNTTSNLPSPISYFLLIVFKLINSDLGGYSGIYGQ